MNIQKENGKVKLYDKVLDLVSRARILALTNNPACDAVLKELDFVLTQMDVQEYLWDFEKFQVERAIKMDFKKGHVSNDGRLISWEIKLP